MAVGNTFGATALSSYGGFWIAYGILLTPNWNILGADGPYSPAETKGDPLMAQSAVGFFLTGWFIFTTILLLCTLRSTVMFFLLFFTLDLAFLMLACGAYATDNGNAEAASKLNQAGGGFGMLAAFLAWYNAFAGIADSRYVGSLLFAFFLSPRCFLPVIMHWPRPLGQARRERTAAGLDGCLRQAKPPRTPPPPHPRQRLTQGSSRQQLVLPHSRLPLPLVREGPRGSSRQDGVCHRLEGGRVPTLCILRYLTYTVYGIR
jgi:succinate-acetate transporter protein